MNFFESIFESDWYFLSFFLIVVFAGIFVVSRNYRLKLNQIFSGISLLGAIWIYLAFYFDTELIQNNFKTLIFSLPSIVGLFILIAVSDLEDKLFRFREDKDSFRKKVVSLLKITLALETVLIISLLVLLKIINIFDDQDSYSSLKDSLTYLIILTNTLAIWELLVFSAFRFFVASKSIFRSGLVGQKSWNMFIAQHSFLFFAFTFLHLLLLFKSLGSTDFDLEEIFQSLGGHIFVDIQSAFFVGILITLAIAISSYYFLNLKVILAEALGALVMSLNLFIFIYFENDPVNFAIRLLLLVSIFFLSFFLVGNVVRETLGKKKIQDTAKKILESNKLLGSLDRAKSEFINTASHQLRSPLSAVKGIVSMLLDNTYGKVSARLRDPLEKIYLSNERLINLIEDLLDVSRLESGRMDFNFTKVDLNKLAKKSTENLSLQARNKKLYLKFIPLKNPKLEVFADEEKVTESIMNLIDNAIKYTRKGGITVEVKKAGRMGRVYVRDTGIGLKDSEIDNLFQKFVRSGRGNKLSTVGTGLGLYVVKKMILAHMGKIWAESNGENRGSSFIVELPLDLKNPPSSEFVKKIVSEK